MITIAINKNHLSVRLTDKMERARREKTRQNGEGDTLQQRQDSHLWIVTFALIASSRNEHRRFGHYMYILICSIESKIY